MGTSNFGSYNTSKLYVVLESYEDEETGETIYPEVEDVEMFNDDLSRGLEELFGYSNVLEQSDGSWYCTVAERTYYRDVHIALRLVVSVKSGYYEAAWLDFDKRVEVNCNYSDDIEYSVRLDGYSRAVQIGRWATQWVEKQEALQVQRLETLFDQLSTTKLQLAARFSNGEAIYHKVD